jgi:hypothetical protein
LEAICIFPNCQPTSQFRFVLQIILARGCGQKNQSGAKGGQNDTHSPFSVWGVRVRLDLFNQATAGSSDLADAAFFFRLKAHKDTMPVAKSGNVAGSGTTVPVINVSGPVPNENVAPVIVVVAETPDSARVNWSCPRLTGHRAIVIELA